MCSKYNNYNVIVGRGTDIYIKGKKMSGTVWAQHFDSQMNNILTFFFTCIRICVVHFSWATTMLAGTLNLDFTKM